MGRQVSQGAFRGHNSYFVDEMPFVPRNEENDYEIAKHHDAFRPQNPHINSPCVHEIMKTVCNFVDKKQNKFTKCIMYITKCILSTECMLHHEMHLVNHEMHFFHKMLMVHYEIDFLNHKMHFVHEMHVVLHEMNLDNHGMTFVHHEMHFVHRMHMVSHSFF